LADDGPVEIAETATYTEEFPGTRFRERGATAVDTYDATAYEREAYGTVVAGAVEALDESPTAVAPTAPDGKRPYRVARRLDGDVDIYQAANELGDTGAASAFFGLLSAWDDNRDEVTVVTYGDGASAVAARVVGTLTASWNRTTVDLSYAEYARKRGHIVATGGDD
jgi:hydroxymethylglutaryl-CoA synthase